MNFNDLMKDLYYSSDEEKPVRGRPKGKKTPLSKEQQRARNAELEAKRRQREKKGYMALAISLGIDPNIHMSRDEVLARALSFIKENKQPLDELKKRNKELKREVKKCKRRLAESSVEPSPKRYKKSKHREVPDVDEPANSIFSRPPLKAIEEFTPTAAEPATPTGSIYNMRIKQNISLPPLGVVNHSTYPMIDRYNMQIKRNMPPLGVVKNYESDQCDELNFGVSGEEEVVSSTSPWISPAEACYQNNRSLVKQNFSPPPSLVTKFEPDQYDVFNVGVTAEEDVVSSTSPWISPAEVVNQIPKLLKNEPTASCETGIPPGYSGYGEAQFKPSPAHCTGLISSSVGVKSSVVTPDNIFSCRVDLPIKNENFESCETGISPGYSGYGEVQFNSPAHCTGVTPNNMLSCKVDLSVEEIIAEIPASISDSIMNELTTYLDQSN